MPRIIRQYGAITIGSSSAVGGMAPWTASMNPNSTTRLTAVWNSADPSETTGSISQRKHDLLDVVGVGENQRRRTQDHLGEQLEHDEAREQDDGELGGGRLGGRVQRTLAADGLPLGPQHDTEHERVDREHEQRRQQRPQDTEHRPAVAAGDLTTDEGQDEAAHSNEGPAPTGLCPLPLPSAVANRNAVTVIGSAILHRGTRSRQPHPPDRLIPAAALAVSGSCRPRRRGRRTVLRSSPQKPASSSSSEETRRGGPRAPCR